IDKAYDTDAEYDPDHKKTQWQRFEHKVSQLNREGGSRVRYKLLYCPFPPPPPPPHPIPDHLLTSSKWAVTAKAITMLPKPTMGLKHGMSVNLITTDDFHTPPILTNHPLV